MNDPNFEVVDTLLKSEHGTYFHDREDGNEAEDEEEFFEGFESNVRQAELRAAAQSGLYDVLMAAGTISSGKTYGIAALITEFCINFPETLVLVVRQKREDLEDKTIPDFEAVAPPGAVERFNRSKLNQYFTNGSVILYRSANEQADRLFAWLKGLKIDILFIDECDGVSREFYGMGVSRVGIARKRSRQSLANVKPMTFLACNPNISWPKEVRDKYTYKPEAMLPDRAYYQTVTIQDNIKYVSLEKQAQWKRLMPPPMYKRFVLGSWDAMSDLEQLFLFDDMDRCKPWIEPPIELAYTDDAGVHHPAKPGKWKRYLGVDPARFGPDKCTFLILEGPNLRRLDFYAETRIDEIVFHVKQLMAEYGITPDHITIDVVGLGAGVCDMLGADHIWVNQHNGAQAPDDAAFYQEDPTNPASKINMDNAAFSFQNKRAQSHWEAMQALRAGRVGAFGMLGWKDEVNIDEMLRSDMAAIHYGFAKGSKAIKIEDKEEIKKRLHRSPDFSDVFVLAWDAYLHDLKKPSMEIHVF